MIGKLMFIPLQEPKHGMKIVWGTDDQAPFTRIHVGTINEPDLSKEHNTVMIKEFGHPVYIHELKVPVVEFEDSEPWEYIPNTVYKNRYDDRWWVYRPAPCPMPYWGNPKTLGGERKMVEVHEDMWDNLYTFIDKVEDATEVEFEITNGKVTKMSSI